MMKSTFRQRKGGLLTDQWQWAAVAQGWGQCYWKVAGSIPLVSMSLGQDTEPQTVPDVLVGTLHGSHRHQCMKSIWAKTTAKCRKCKCNVKKKIRAAPFAICQRPNTRTTVY